MSQGVMSGERERETREMMMSSKLKLNWETNRATVSLSGNLRGNQWNFPKLFYQHVKHTHTHTHTRAVDLGKKSSAPVIRDHLVEERGNHPWETPNPSFGASFSSRHRNKKFKW
jgi:hypothetical protein